MSANLERLEAYRAANLEAAHIIAADPAKYGGEEALLVIWARRVLQGGVSIRGELAARACPQPPRTA
jgi:hypothetical protein